LAAVARGVRPAGRDVLLDTGPLVAALDARDQWHARCVAVWPTVIHRCVTTEAVVTEACHLVLRGGGRAHLPLDFLLRAQIPILGIESGGHLRAAGLMDRYTDLPMDYADASLVALGEALRITAVFTIDQRGFGAYRRSGGGAFTLVLEV
jgi:predicted nucleic acid-binding protein